jgi:hypothetical protein
MLPEVLNNHFDYLIPDQIIPLVVGEGNDENHTSDSEDSYHGLYSTSDAPSDTNAHNTSYDGLDNNENTNANVPNEPTNVLHAPGADTLENENLNTDEKNNVDTSTNPSSNINATGAGTLPTKVTLTARKIKNVLPVPSLNQPCLPPSTTRSGQPYTAGSRSTRVPHSLPSASPSLLGRTGKVLGKLLDSHPLSEIKRKNKIRWNRPKNGAWVCCYSLHPALYYTWFPISCCVCEKF